MDAKPEEFDGFTQADGDQLRAMSQAINPETGQPYYDIQDNGRGGLQVRNNFNFAGQDGQMVDPGSITGVQPRRVTEFLGQRREGSMTPEQLDSARYRAMADAVSRGDPVAGLRMRREANAEDRAAEQFKRDDWRFGREQVTARREDDELAFTDKMRQGMSQFMDQRLVGPDGQRRDPTPEDAIAAMQHQATLFAKNGRPEMAGAAMKDYMQVAVAQVQMQTAERRQAFGRATAAAMNGDLRPMVEAFNRFIPDGTRVIDYQVGRDGSVTVKRETLDGRKLPDARLSSIDELVVALQTFDDPNKLLEWSQQQFQNNLARANLGLKERQVRAAESSATSARRQIQVFRDRDGQIVMLDVAALPTGQDGTMRIPDGLVPLNERSAFTEADVQKLTDQILTNNTPDPNNPRQPVRDPMVARQMALQLLNGQQPQTLAERIIAAAGGEGPATNTPAAAPEEAPRGLQRPGTRGEAAATNRMRVELNRQFESLPEVQALMQQIAEQRGAARGGRGNTTELARQLATMREEFLRQNLPQ